MGKRATQYGRHKIEYWRHALENQFVILLLLVVNCLSKSNLVASCAKQDTHNQTLFCLAVYWPTTINNDK